MNPSRKIKGHAVILMCGIGLLMAGCVSSSRSLLKKNDWVSGVLQSSGLVKSLYPAEISQARAFLGKLSWRSYFFTVPADGETGCAVNFTTNKGDVIRVSLHKYGTEYSLHLRNRKNLFVTTLSDEESRLVMSFAGYYENPVIIKY